MSLLHPPQGFPPHLAMFWPLIWVQVLLLRAAVRAAYGKGTQYHWSVTPNGRVFLTSIDWLPGQKSEPAIVKPSIHANNRLAAACDGRAFTPDYVAILSRNAFPAACDPGQRSLRPVALAPLLEGNLPLPET
ncbi:MAG: hypothetical protein R3B94_08165 [Hyphomonas sp.]